MAAAMILVPFASKVGELIYENVQLGICISVAGHMPSAASTGRPVARTSQVAGGKVCVDEKKNGGYTRILVPLFVSHKSPRDSSEFAHMYRYEI
jgi:hypothetical protein